MTRAHRNVIFECRRAVLEYQSAVTDCDKQAAGDKVLSLRDTRKKWVAYWRLGRLLRAALHLPLVHCLSLFGAIVLMYAVFPHEGRWSHDIANEMGIVLPVMLLSATMAAWVIAYAVSTWLKRHIPFLQILSLLLVLMLLTCILSRIIVFLFPLRDRG